MSAELTLTARPKCTFMHDIVIINRGGHLVEQLLIGTGHYENDAGTGEERRLHCPSCAEVAGRFIAIHRWQDLPLKTTVVRQM